MAVAVVAVAVVAVVVTEAVAVSTPAIEVFALVLIMIMRPSCFYGPPNLLLKRMCVAPKCSNEHYLLVL